MRRGFSLEYQIGKLINYVKAIGFHGQKNHPERTTDGTYIEGEPFDYLILTDTYKAAFDAKESKSENWNLSNAKLHQINNLKHCKNAGLDAFFLVYYYPTKQLIKFDIDIIIHCLEINKKSLKAAEGEVYDFPNQRKN